VTRKPKLEFSCPCRSCGLRVDIAAAGAVVVVKRLFELELVRVRLKVG
jgi:hypothetical protein